MKLNQDETRHKLQTFLSACEKTSDHNVAEAYRDCTKILEKLFASIPSGEALTLDELQRMEGEPVWIAPAKPGGRIPSRWMLFAGVTAVGVYLFEPAGGIAQGYDEKKYKQTWTAYRIPPYESSESR